MSFIIWSCTILYTFTVFVNIFPQVKMIVFYSMGTWDPMWSPIFHALNGWVAWIELMWLGTPSELALNAAPLSHITALCYVMGEVGYRRRTYLGGGISILYVRGWLILGWQNGFMLSQRHHILFNLVFLSAKSISS